MSYGRGRCQRCVVQSSGTILWDDPKKDQWSESLGSWSIERTGDFLSKADCPVPLMRHDPNDLGSLILFRIIPKVELYSRKNVGLVFWELQIYHESLERDSLTPGSSGKYHVLFNEELYSSKNLSLIFLVTTDVWWRLFIYKVELNYQDDERVYRFNSTLEILILLILVHFF